MPAQDTSKIKEKMISILKEKGPSLPVHIANGTGLSILFASAFLSELLSEKKLEISNMKVGSSPLYYLPEQKHLLESFSHHLGSKEKEAFSLLKEKKTLRDREQEPAIRVALRSIKDFALPITENGEWYWKYFNAPEKEIQKEIPEEKIIEQVLETQKEETKQEEQEEKKSEEKKEELDIFDKPSGKELSEIILDFLENNKIKLIEETESKKREFLGIGRIETDLGEMELLIIGKDKKKISEKDLEKVLELGIERKKVVLFLCTGEIDKKAKDFFRECKNLIKFFKI